MDKASEPLPIPSQETIEDPDESDQLTDDSTGPEDDESDEEETRLEKDKQETGESGEEEDTGDHRLCPACGFQVDVGSSICVVCGNTLS